MRKERTIAGFRDYRGVNLADIINDLKSCFYLETIEDIRNLKEIGKQITAHQDKVDDPISIISFIDLYISLFSDFAAEFNRLSLELAKRVAEGHLNALSDICLASRETREDHSKDFAREFLWRDLKDETWRPMLERIDMIVDNRLSCNLLLPAIISRLEVYLGTGPDIGLLTEQEGYIKHVATLPIPPETEWSQIEFECHEKGFLRLSVCGKVIDTYDYEELRFRNEHTKKPNKLWSLLLGFAKYGGVISFQNIARLVTDKDVSRLRKELRRLAPIDGNPIRYDKNDHAYVANFQITLAGEPEIGDGR